MRRFILLLVIIGVCEVGYASHSDPLSELERAMVFVIHEEATDYALEARSDVCLAIGTDLPAREGAVLAALKDKGLNFHANDWCNRGPRGVTIDITMPRKQTSVGTYEIVSALGDSDPIRLYGDHFATLLRKGAYTIKCEKGSEPTLVSYQLICCDKGKIRSKAGPCPN